MTTTAAPVSIPTAAAPAASPALRLAYLTTKYPAVSHTFIRREIRELERRGHHVVRLAIRPADSAPVDPADIQEQSRTTHVLSQPALTLMTATIAAALSRPGAFLSALASAFSMAKRSDRGVMRHLAYLVEACFLLRVVRRERVQHLHVHFGTNAAAVALLMRRLGGPPYSLTVHGPDEFDAPVGLSLAEKVRDASFVVAITQFCAAQIKRWTPPQHWSKIHVVGCTVGEEFFDASTPVDPASRTLVCVGRLNAQKGHLLLLDAFARVVRSTPDARLVLAGDGELRAAVESRIAALGLQRSVEITGWIDEAQVRRRIQESRALVMASFAEGLPMVLMEALALGRPVIAPAISGIPELVKHGQSGWLVTAGSVDELAETMREVLAAPAARLEEIADAGCEHVRRDHHTTTETAKLEALLLSAKDQA